MKRITEGVLFSGDSRCVQKQGPVLKICGFIFTKGYIPVCALGVVLLFMALSKDSGKILYWSISVILLGLMLFLDSYIWGDASRCPYCKHFFTMKRISDDVLVGRSTSASSERVYENHSGMAFDFAGNSAFYSGVSSHREARQNVVDTLAFNRRCTCCGAVSKKKRNIYYKK